VLLYADIRRIQAKEKAREQKRANKKRK